ncbi:MAG: excinuclease ABC subunit UvrA [Clostridia bacterium]|nr:excinuclease ABC subunit UvrA [Clostridia bacterium]
MARELITVKGARENNLKNIDVEIPRDKLVVFTGLSGSGKSSLAFDTLFAEGNRRFVESLSSYARMFLGQIDKPDVDSIDGLSPAISIDQKTTSKNPRSTVGTVTEIYDYLRLLYARCGVPHCPVCNKEIKQQTIDQIVDKILELPERTKIQVLSPIARGKKGQFEKQLDEAMKNGFVRARIDGYVYDIADRPQLDKNIRHNIEIVVDRLIIKSDISRRLSDSLETAAKLSDGYIVIDLTEKPGEEITFSLNYACEEHGISIGELMPRMFSFNNPFGACSECGGLGVKNSVSFEKIIPDTSLSLSDGAVVCNGFKSADEGGWLEAIINAVGRDYGFDINTPVCEYSPKAREVLLYGTGDKKHAISHFSMFSGGVKDRTVTFDGLLNIISKRYSESRNEYYEQFMNETPCHACRGMRLKKESLAVTVGDLNISRLCDLSVKDMSSFFDSLVLPEKEKIISKEIVKEINSRLDFLKNVGLDYLTLSRRAGTLSGGESQRIRLATQIGSALMGVMYILDEPSIGLHQRDNTKLIETLKKLRDVGNTVIVVEHDEETIENADYVVDIGPGAGIHGGQVVFSGTPEKLKEYDGSVTGRFLSGKENIPVPKKRRNGNGNFIKIVGARENNLKNIDVEIPLGCFVAVTGVSGSGKSSLINGILHKQLSKTLNRAVTFPGAHKEILGTEHLDKVIAIDQAPIGRTPRSNPATYTGLFTDIRTLFAKTPDAKARGYGSNRFSFNLKGGRCEACEGDGTLKIEMHFLPDVYVNCDVCKGKRYNRETLEIKYKGKNIFDVLDMTVEEGVGFFDSIPSIKRRLMTLYEVGLGYIKIGQSSLTLSGGEAQRVKLATELSKRSTGRTVYILDEPTTGLHSADVKKLIEVLQKLVDSGNTVIVIEHNLDVIKTADYVIDLGPEGGDGGGKLVACGTPEEIAKCKKSYTGQYLERLL